MRAAYIIPGFHRKASARSYKKIMSFFKYRGIKPVPVKISWKYRTMSDYINQFLKQYKPGEVYLFGFSFGSMIAFIASARIKPKMQILCSLSPYFKEDLPYSKELLIKDVGKRRADDMKNYSFDELVKKIECKTILLSGSKEHRDLKKRVRTAHKKLKNSELIIVKGARHKINQKKYMDSIKKVIDKL